MAGNDGVGTKLKVAIAAGKHDTVGIDLVAMCVNDIIVQGAEPLFFLDYYASGKLDVKQAADVVKGIAEGCLLSGAGLIGGETAEMPSMYAAGDYDIAGFSVGGKMLLECTVTSLFLSNAYIHFLAVKRKNLLPRVVYIGDVILGLASSGLHSNGFSLVRKLIASCGLSYSDKAPFDTTRTLADVLLTPTRIYVKSLLPLINEGHIEALAHITGGGLNENIPRVLPSSVAVEIKKDSWTIPKVFQWLGELGNLPSHELTRTFNCGIGMCVVVKKERKEEVLRALRAGGEIVYEIGVVVERASPTAPQVVFS